MSALYTTGKYSTPNKEILDRHIDYINKDRIAPEIKISVRYKGKRYKDLDDLVKARGVDQAFKDRIKYIVARREAKAKDYLKQKIELFADGFAKYVDDRNKMRQEAPELARIYDDLFKDREELRDFFQAVDDTSGYSRDRLMLHDEIIKNKISDMIVIDPDIVKEHIPEYDPGNPELVHKESSDITRKMLFKRIKEFKPGTRVAVNAGVAGAGKTTVLGKLAGNYKLIYETTAKNHEKTLRFIRTAQRKGLIVDVNLVGIPLKSSLDAQEYRRSKGQRAVPDDIVRKNYPETYKTFNGLRDHADNWRMYDHSSIGKPQAVAEKLDGQFNILDGMLYNRMVNAYEEKKPKKRISKRAGNKA